MQLIAEFLSDSSHRILGDTFDIGLRNVRNEIGSDISDGTTGVVSVYDSSGTLKVTAADFTITGTKRLKAVYQLRTGSGFPITAAGTYRAEHSIVLSDLTKKTWQQYIEIKANPF